MRLIIAAACLSLCSCGSGSGAPSPSAMDEQPTPVVATTAALKRPRVEDAKLAIAKEKQVLDFVLEPTNAVALQVAVRDDGSARHGYAEYLCLILADYDFDMTDTSVRVVDAAKVASSNGDFRSISLGAVQCKDGSHLD